ncbi:MAG TPA: Nramp family divalent metal transporter [Steroidobacteraceae bacterium]|nr:Nramp family divalent metal transporter [Steroidobacteraceae bacterium]
MSSVATNERAPPTKEARSGLDPWVRAELPVPPMPKGFGWMAVVGPGVIVLGLSIGSGEFLLGPAVFVKYGLTLLWVTGVAILFQTVFNTEVMRYVLATGEPVFSGFMRTRPSATWWAWFYTALYFLQFGWPAWAATAAGAIFFLFAGHLPGSADAAAVYYVGAGAFALCVALLLVGRRIERTLEILNWVLVTVILGSFLVLAVVFVPARTWLAATFGFAGFDLTSGSFELLPEGVDFFLLGALVAYSGCGGVGNIALGNWARDKGYGMSQHAGYIPTLSNRDSVKLAHHGFTFVPDAESMRRWQGWWRIVRADQWGVFCLGALLGMALPALLYVTFLPAGTDIRGLGISAALAQGVGAEVAPLLGVVIAILGAWLLFKTQLDGLDGFARSVSDILWTGSRRVRAWRGGDICAIYYSVLALIVLWGLIALSLAPPIMLLQISANVAAVILAIAAPHLLYVNMRLLPPALRPPMWRRVALVCMSAFYCFFAILSLRSLL